MGSLKDEGLPWSGRRGAKARRVRDTWDTGSVQVLCALGTHLGSEKGPRKKREVVPNGGYGHSEGDVDCGRIRTPGQGHHTYIQTHRQKRTETSGSSEMYRGP